MEGNERKGIIPLSRMANSVGSDIFEGNDRDLVWDREIRADSDSNNPGHKKDGEDMPKEIQFISFEEAKK
ncbi:MAG: hypothetical protein K5770_01305 [Lachnospiraceae bacterium]|nr:hypothetical protein [Lachnospiraceae bacterium]